MHRNSAIAFLCIIILLSAHSAYAFKTLVVIEDNASDNTSEQFVTSVPGENQALDQSPAAITITFSRPVQADKSALKLYNLYGTQLNDGALNVNGQVMSIPVPQPLPPGRYAVKWKAHCACNDDNEISGEFHFTVR